MPDIKKYEDIKNQALLMFASGYDNKYIEIQLAEKGVADATIDSVIRDIAALKKSQKKKKGVKLLIYGASFIVVGFAFTLFSFEEGSPIRFVLWGLVISGVLTLVKGLADIIGL